MNRMINFGATPVFRIKLKQYSNDGFYHLVNAKFSRLVYSNKNDCETMYKVCENWHAPKGFNNYADSIVYNFQTPRPYKRHFITELQEKGKNLYSRLTSIIELTNPQIQDKEIFEIYYIQSSPKILETKQLPLIKGAGELAVYGAVKLAKNNGFEKIRLLSTNDTFYEKIGFEQQSSLSRSRKNGVGSYYILPKEKYDLFMKNIERKYSL